MFESGYYPLGAEHDPRAPYNEVEPRMVKCEACNGTGHHWYAYDFVKNEEAECTEQEWLALPESEEGAQAALQTCIRGLKEPCEVCDGAGEVEYEEDYEPDYDD